MEELYHDCFKIDKSNAISMIKGVNINGQNVHQSIWLDVKNKKFPKLLTLNKRETRFPLSRIGKSLSSDNIVIDYKYVVVLDTEYFVRNDISLWERICSNGLFNIWEPEAPLKRFNEAKSDPTSYRIQLVRVFEIHNAFRDEDVIPAGRQYHHLVCSSKTVYIKKPIISNEEFKRIKNLLAISVKDFLVKPSVPHFDTTTIQIAENTMHCAKIKYKDFGDAPDDDPNQLQNFAKRVRQGQPRFRENLLKAYGNKCAVTGHGPEQVLEAVHIIPHASSGVNKIDNGLLLRSDLHYLFDSDLIRIHPQSFKIQVDTSLLNTPYAKLHGARLRERTNGSQVAVQYLQQRWDKKKD